MASNISETNILPTAQTNWTDRINWLYPTLALAIFLCFFKLGSTPIEQWDEAHTGINAIEMLQTGDYINLHYGGAPDRIRAKPPFVIWMVSTNFSLFGYNAFSLRLHSAIAGVFIFFFLFKIVNLYRSSLFAFGVCLMLFSVQAVIGYHVTRTGDFDAVLIAFLFAGLYYFLRYLDFMRYHDIYKAAILWGLAFFTKGLAFAILFPGLLVYLLLDGRLLHVLRLREVYKAIGILLLFPICWYIVIYFFGYQADDPGGSGRNAFERMFLYDIVDRFTQHEFEGKQKSADPLFLWHVLRENFRHWDLVFYAVLLGGIIRKILTGLPNWEPLRYRFTILSICIWVPPAIFLALGNNSKYWYFAPAIPFVAATAMSGIWWLYKQFPKIVMGGFLLFWLFCMYYRYLGPKPQPTEGSMPEEIYTQVVHRQAEKLAGEEKIYQVGPWPDQRVLLDLYFANPNVTYASTEEALSDPAGNISVFIRREAWEKQQERFVDFAIMDEDEFYLILEKN